jgi:hypothetical protein
VVSFRSLRLHPEGNCTPQTCLSYKPSMKPRVILVVYKNYKNRLHLPGIEPKFLQAGCVTAQWVSRWLPTAAVRVRARVRSCGICGGQSGNGADFLRVLRFPLPVFFPQFATQSPSSIWGWYNMPVVAAVSSGLSLTKFLQYSSPKIVAILPQLFQF